MKKSFLLLLAFFITSSITAMDYTGKLLGDKFPKKTHTQVEKLSKNLYKFTLPKKLSKQIEKLSDWVKISALVSIITAYLMVYLSALEYIA